MAIFRPEPTAERRQIFNLVHFWVGFIAHVASGTHQFINVIISYKRLFDNF